jgi:hypothetical protein
MNKNIRFSHNWNQKLDCDIFTTIRRYEKSKSQYYTPGDVFNVYLNDTIKTQAKLIDKEIHIFGDIVRWQPDLLALDAGLWDVDEVCAVFDKFKINRATPAMILKFWRIKS